MAAAFVADRLDGLSDEPWPGALRLVSDDQIEQVVVATLERAPQRPPTGREPPSLPRLACRSRRGADLASVRLETASGGYVQLSSDPLFIEKGRRRRRL